MRRRKILAIGSGGGHFIELLRVRPALAGHFVVWATVSSAYAAHLPDAPLRVIPDVTRWDRLGLARGLAEVTALLLRERPDVVMSAGALPGFLGLVIGKRLGARTMWLDSLANVDELSLSGQRVGPHADLWLTQWPELSKVHGPRYAGSVLRLGAATLPPPQKQVGLRIFVTVGAQMPFDRLIAAIDAWAVAHPQHHVRAQIGESTYAPRALTATRFLSPEAFERAYDEADVIVGHAGIGTLFAALERGKPVVVLPREAARRETRNDHQTATAQRFEALAGVKVAWREDELDAALDAVGRGEVPRARLEPSASPELLDAVSGFIDGRMA